MLVLRRGNYFYISKFPQYSSPRAELYEAILILEMRREIQEEGETPMLLMFLQGNGSRLISMRM